MSIGKVEYSTMDVFKCRVGAIVELELQVLAGMAPRADQDPGPLLQSARCLEVGDRLALNGEDEDELDLDAEVNRVVDHLDGEVNKKFRASFRLYTHVWTNVQACTGRPFSTKVQDEGPGL